MVSEEMRTRISKCLAYLLRHDKNLPRTEDGWVPIPEVLKLLQKRWQWINSALLQEIVEKDKKQRYEIRNNMIRARYGHSVPVNLHLPAADVDVLYHGTTPNAAMQILKEGLKPMGRTMVHLSTTPSDAMAVGKRRTKTPTVLKIDAKKAQSMGISFFKASESVYLASSVPPECISIWGEGNESLEGV